MTGRRLPPEERRAAILAAAREQFSRRPFSAVSIGDVAAAAGVSPPLVVFYFGSKNALYLEVLGTAVTSIVEGLAAVPGPPSLERLHASVRFYAQYAHEHRAGFLSWLRGAEAALPEAEALVESLRRRICDQIVADVVADLPAADDALRTVLQVGVRAYLGYVDAAVIAWLDLSEEQRADVTDETIAELAVGAFTGTLARLPGPAPTPSATGAEPSHRGP